MDWQELTLKCQRIVAGVQKWMLKQDELTLALHCVTTAMIQIDDGTTLETVLECLLDENPALLAKYGVTAIESRAKAFLGSDFKDLAPLFNGFYREFNTRFFNNRLPPYYLRIAHNCGRRRIHGQFEGGFIDAAKNKLVIHYDGIPSNTLGWLVFLMARVRRGWDRVVFQHELRRLTIAGAPTFDAINCLSEAGWTVLSPLPSSPS